MRNYKKEVIWLNNKYERINARIDKNLGVELKKKLKSENISISSWITNKAIEYLKK